jgi:ribulose-bisphosphate carboxylase large chain
MTDRIEADYILESPIDPRRAAEVIAGEQSSGTFVKTPGETAALKDRAAARIEQFERLETVDAPSLAGAASPGPAGHGRARLTLSWPMDNLGADLTAVMATVAGNLFELNQVSGLRLLDIRLPLEFVQSCPCPAHGVAGTRALTGVDKGPVIGTIIKPSVGLDAMGTAALVAQLAAGGIDFIKDDELQINGPLCPFEDRVRAVMGVINAHADRTGKRVMFAFNVTGEVDEMRRRHDLVHDLGGTCVMANLTAVGVTGLLALRRHSALPIHAHRNGWGYLSRAPMLGWSYPAWSQIWRLAGADHMHVNGLDNKFCEDNDSVMASARAQLSPLHDTAPATAMPVFSSGQTIWQAPETHRRLGATDLIYAAGGGIMGHPDGPAAGVTSLRSAWDAAAAGIDLHDYAKDHPALARAMEVFAK